MDPTQPQTSHPSEPNSSVITQYYEAQLLTFAKIYGNMP